MKVENGKILFENGIELDLRTGETTELFLYFPECDLMVEKSSIPDRETIEAMLRKYGYFCF